MLIHIINGPRLRGAERFALELAQSMSARGVRQMIIALRGLDSEVPPMAGCEVIVVPPAIGVITRLRWLRRRLLSRPDSVVLCHGQGPQKETVIALLASGEARPFVAVKQIGMLMHWLKSRVDLRIRFNTWLMSRTDICICLGPRQADEVRNLLGVPAGKVVQIPNGRRVPAGLPGGIARDRRQILVVGSLSPEKNPSVALDVFRMVRKVVPDCRLTFVGDGPLRSVLEASVRSSMPSGSVTFLGHVTDVWQLYLRAGAVVLCSQTEGVPGTVIEATLSGAPTVAWEVGDVAEVLRDGCNGRLTPFGDLGALANALCDVVADEARWEQFCSNTRMMAESMSFDVITEAYLSVLPLNKHVRGSVP